MYTVYQQVCSTRARIHNVLFQVALYYEYDDRSVCVSHILVRTTQRTHPRGTTLSCVTGAVHYFVYVFPDYERAPP